jgi:hypothetical protein
VNLYAQLVVCFLAFTLSATGVAKTIAPETTAVFLVRSFGTGIRTSVVGSRLIGLVEITFALWLGLSRERSYLCLGLLMCLFLVFGLARFVGRSNKECGCFGPNNTAIKERDVLLLLMVLTASLLTFPKSTQPILGLLAAAVPILVALRSAKRTSRAL